MGYNMICLWKKSYPRSLLSNLILPRSGSGGKWTPFPGTAKKIGVGQAGVFIIDEKNQMKKKEGGGWRDVSSGGDITDISVGQQTVWVVTKHRRIYRWKSSWKKMPGTLTNVCRHFSKGVPSFFSQKQTVHLSKRGRYSASITEFSNVNTLAFRNGEGYHIGAKIWKFCTLLSKHAIFP